jgi:uncharacterized membrane protein required for colicin V production
VADLLLLAFIGGYVRGGWLSGLARRIAGLVFLVVAFLVGAQFRGPIGELVMTVFPTIPAGWTEVLGYGVAFGAVYTGLNLIGGMVLRRATSGGTSRATDRVLGALFGGLEGVVLASVGIVILHTYATPGSTIEALANMAILPNLVSSIDASTIGKFLEATTVPIVLKLLGPFLPSDLTAFLPATFPGGLPGFPIPGGVPGFPIPGGAPGFPIPGVPLTLPTAPPGR